PWKTCSGTRPPPCGSAAWPCINCTGNNLAIGCGMTTNLRHTAAVTPGETIAGISAPRSRWLVPAIYLLFAVAMALLSRGFMEADEISHFLYARSVWHNWRLIVSIWGRFGCTAFFGLAAPFGLTAARVLAVSVTAMTGWG